jgi:tetratricopeptide (TPR) repeat protein
MDELSEEALAVLGDTIATAPVLLLATYRPGYVPPLGERAYATRLHLHALRPEQSDALLEAMLQVPSLPSQLQQLITGKAEGNPFYIEEVTRALLEIGALQRRNGSYTLARPLDQIHIPNTIQEVILSRIDRLEREAKEALQLASVIGREFTVQLLGRISDVETPLDTALQELKTLELIYQKAYFPELAYMFKHALTHDVAYATLLMERRKALHRIVAAAVEELYADRLPEQYETLAYHYSHGEEWPKALQYLEKAGDKATAAYANQDALDFYARALEVCAKLGDSALAASATVAQKRGFVNFGIANFPGAMGDFERLLGTAQRLRDRHLEGLALVFRGMAEMQAHTFEVAEATLRDALAMAHEGFDDVRFAASLWLSWTLTMINRHTEAQPILHEAETLAPLVDDPISRAWLSMLNGLRTTWPGRFDAALAILERWRRATEESHQMIAILGNRWVEALARGAKGDFEQALTILAEIVTTCERVGEVWIRMRALNTIGWIYHELQDHERALEWNTRGVRAGQEHTSPDPEIEGNARLNLGDTLLALGRLDEAEEHYRWVEQVARHPRPEERWMLWRYAQHLFHSYGELWRLRGDHAQALAYADDCLRLAEGSESRKNMVKGRRLRGQVFLAQDQLGEAEQEIATALTIAQEIGNPPQLWKTLVALGDLRQAQGRAAEAQHAYRDALAVVANVAAGLTDTALRDTLLHSAHVQQIRHRLQAVGQHGAAPADVP